MPGEVITFYQKEVLSIAEYDNERKPDGNPDRVQEHVQYSQVVKNLVTGERRTEIVTDAATIAEIERRNALNQGG